MKKRLRSELKPHSEVYKTDENGTTYILGYTLDWHKLSTEDISNPFIISSSKGGRMVKSKDLTPPMKNKYEIETVRHYSLESHVETEVDRNYWHLIYSSITSRFVVIFGQIGFETDPLGNNYLKFYTKSLNSTLVQYFMEDFPGLQISTVSTGNMLLCKIYKM